MPSNKAKPREAYRIFDDKAGEPHTLFHGLNGSRKLPMNKWLKAKVHLVTDGSGVTYYQSGFHVLEDKKKAKEVFQAFFRLPNRSVARVLIRDTWTKKHSRHGVTLARYMKLLKKDWEKRVRVS